MKIIKFTFSILITFGLFFILNFPLGSIPPLGKFLSPHQGFLQNAEKEWLEISNSYSFNSSLSSPVSVTFDELLIPHIEAENDKDLYFAQGYITAYHRLWQMEMQLYKTAGRISELLGDKYIEFDKSQRRKGLTYGANRALEELKKTPELYEKIEAYSQGVNAYIATLSPAKYPIEYKLLDYAPEPWSAYKTCLLLKEMADQLSRGDMDLEHTNALNLWGMEMVDLLYPESFPGLDPVIPKGTKFDFDPIKIDKPNVDYPFVLSKRKIENPDPSNGSNNFAVDATKSTDGSTLMANEPDLGLNLPSIWYLAHLTSPTRNVMGATLPGAPGIIIGFNDSIAWGNTNAKRDLVDWYTIEFKNEKREEYRYGDKWLKTQKIVEEIKTKNGKSFYDTIIYTHYGPVTYDKSFGLNDYPNTNLAMRWTAHDPSEEIRAIDLVNKANNYEDFVAAFSYFTGPPQNYSMISAKGDIALWIHGKFPVKWDQQGRFIMNGSDPSYEWATYMPQEHNYHIKNPSQHFVSSANQHPGDSTYPYYDFDYNWEYYRNRRINDRLKALQKVTPQEMMKLQNDNFNYNASEVLPIFLSKIDSSFSLNEYQKEIIATLSTWDYFNEPTSIAASYYESWWDSFYSIVWDEFKDSKVSLYTPHTYNTYFLMKYNPEFAFFDKVNTNERESLNDLIKESFLTMCTSIEKWEKERNEKAQWFKYKNTTILHLLQLKPFSFSEVQIGGNHGIVNAASERHGPSWRMVVQYLPNKKLKGFGIYPGSQSGNPGNPSYGHMIPKWANGEYFDLGFYKENITVNKTIKLLPN